ncbi:MAG: hypothetical protein ACLPY3_01545 [Solirubrobacteraceae bacterium]
MGRGLGAPPTPYSPPELPAGTVNLTDPESRIVQSRRGFMQGYTAQAVATKEQIVITADVIAAGKERQTLEPLIDKAHQELSQAGVTQNPASANAELTVSVEHRPDRQTDRSWNQNAGQSRRREPEDTLADSRTTKALPRDA